MDARAPDEPKIYLVHSSLGPDALAALPHVVDHHALDEHLAFVETTLTRTRLYHEVKWAAPPDTPLLVVELRSRPKFKDMAPGSTAWIRDRLSDA